MRTDLLLTLVIVMQPVGHAIAALSPEQQAFQDSLRAKVAQMNALTGVTLDPSNIFVFDGEAEILGSSTERASDEAVSENILSWTDESDTTAGRILGVAFEVTRTVVTEGSREVVLWESDTRGNACLIYYPPEGLAQTGHERDTIIYHELFHCYQFEALGGFSTSAFPPWFIEGMAQWVGEEFSGGSDIGEGWYDHYLSPATDMPFFERDYDAYAFYSHLATWTDRTLVLADFPSWIEPASSRLFELIIARAPDLLVRSWTAGIWRAIQSGEPDWGPEWNSDVPGSPPVATEFRRQSVRGTQSVAVDRFRPTHVEFHLDDEQFYEVSFSGVWGRMRITEENTNVMDIPVNGDDVSVRVCFGECDCPNGSAPLDDEEIIKVGHNPIPIALVAKNESGQVLIEDDEPTCCGRDPIDPRLLGTWRLDENEARLLPWIDNEHCDETTAGTHVMRVGPFGATTRTYSGYEIRQTCEFFGGGLIVTVVHAIDGVVTGCLATGAERTFMGNPVLDIDFQNVNDGVRTLRTENGDILASADGWDREPHYLQIGPFDETESLQTSIVILRGEGIEFFKWFPGEGNRLYHRDAE